MRFKSLAVLLAFLLCPVLALASQTSGAALNLHVTNTAAGLMCLGIFIVAYVFVMTEEFTHLRKSKPVVLAAGLIWIVVALICYDKNLPHAASIAVRHNFLEFAELFIFLLVAMTYVNALEERMVFEALRSWLVRRGFSYRQLFWVTGICAFFISPIADNLTTALIMCAVVLAVGADNPKFVTLACINIVVCANAGGAFSPFGDITTLMVWQKGILKFSEFFPIFIPSVISAVVPALIMSFAVPKIQPESNEEQVQMKSGAIMIMVLFLLTILTAIFFHNFVELPPVIGMMTGLGYLNFYAYYLKKSEHHADRSFDIFQKIKRAEWDTLFFFYGVILCVGGLATIGYLEVTSNFLYGHLGASLPLIHQATPANAIVGILSAIVDNIPVMFAVLTMNPVMSNGQWLLVTLTAGIGGSLLSVGSAAGVALMGQSKGQYTFFGHLKWSWAIFIGYVLAIVAHLVINQHLLTKAVS